MVIILIPNLHDNARPHTTVKTKKKIQDFRLELFDQLSRPIVQF
jgi:hypothetical protein